MDIDELKVHRAIARKPELIESKLGIKLDKTSLIHHYPLSSKGEHVDFVFNDVSGVTYLAEVKVRVSPIRVIPQLYDHEYKKFVEMNPDVDKVPQMWCLYKEIMDYYNHLILESIFFLP